MEGFLDDDGGKRSFRGAVVTMGLAVLTCLLAGLLGTGWSAMVSMGSVFWGFLSGMLLTASSLESEAKKRRKAATLNGEARKGG